MNITTNKVKSGMSPISLPGAGGQFGLKKNINIPPVSEDNKEKNIVASEVKEGEEISMQETSSMQVPTMDTKKDVPNKETEISEAFECGVCGKEFKNRIGLLGHSRTHKEKKEVKTGE